MLMACVFEVRSSDGHYDHTYSDEYNYDEEYCPEEDGIRAFYGYDHPPYQYDPTSCSTNQYADCCLWQVEDRYDRVCHEYWCYKYDECVWEYERIICEQC